MIKKKNNEMSKENESDILKQFSLLALKSLSDLSAATQLRWVELSVECRQFYYRSLALKL